MTPGTYYPGVTSEAVTSMVKPTLTSTSLLLVTPVTPLIVTPVTPISQTEQIITITPSLVASKAAAPTKQGGGFLGALILGILLA